MSEVLAGHGGDLALAALARFGVKELFTLNGAHVWPFYDAAVKNGWRILDTRHEQTATFAAEGYAKLTRRPGVAVLTAGPGVTNGVSAVSSAWMNGSPLLVLGGRAQHATWGTGARCRSSTTSRCCRRSPRTPAPCSPSRTSPQP